MQRYFLFPQVYTLCRLVGKWLTNSEKGAWTRKLLPDVTRECRWLNQVLESFRLAQALSGLKAASSSKEDLDNKLRWRLKTQCYDWIKRQCYNLQLQTVGRMQNVDWTTQQEGAMSQGCWRPPLRTGHWPTLWESIAQELLVSWNSASPSRLRKNGRGHHGSKRKWWKEVPDAFFGKNWQSWFQERLVLTAQDAKPAGW